MRARLIINTKIKTNKASSKNNAACTIKDSGIVYACTSTDDVCTNENEPCTNENEPCTNENEPCTNEPCTNENEPCTSDDDDNDGDDDNDNSSDIDIEKFYNFNDKVLGNLIIVSKIKKEFSTTMENSIT